MASKVDLAGGRTVITTFGMSIIFCAVPSAAWAYIDPGTGGMLLQLLLGGFAGALVIVKLYWTRIRELYMRTIHGPKNDRPKNSG